MKLNRTIKKITSLFFAALMITSIFTAFVTPVVANVVPPTSISVSPPAATLTGHNTTFNATVLPAEANQSVTWSVINTTVGTINATTGFFIALAAGTTSVIARSVVDKNITGTATVTVIHPAPTPGNITIRGLRIPEIVICATELATLPIVTRDVTLVDGFGRRTNMTATGPLFDTVLNEKFGINQADLTNVRFAASDGYTIHFHPGVLQNRDIILAYLINNTALTEGDRYWPIRVAVPGERGMFWVRMLTTIEIIDGTHVPILPTSINVTHITVTLNVTETQQFNATVEPANANQRVTWSVDSTTIGRIDATGLFRANATGTVNVTARSRIDRNITRNATVTVRPPTSTSITVMPATVTLTGHNTTFNATVLPAEANQSVTWSVINTTVGTINATTGFFIALAAGNTNVIARSVVDKNITGTATVTVIHPAPTPGNITIRGLRIPEIVICATELATLPIVTREVTLVGGGGRRTNMTVTGPLFDTILREKFGINQTDLTSVNFTASDGFSRNFHSGILQNRNIILAYLVNNTAFTKNDSHWPIRVAVPDEPGMFWVRMLTTITIINGTHVPILPTSIILSTEQATSHINETIQFNATVYPANANQKVTWSVTNATVGTINETGFFRALVAGTVNVTATSVVAPNITRNATVTVRPPPVPGDANGDGRVDIIDFGILAASFMRRTGESGFDSRADFNRDGIVDIRDFGLLAKNFGM